MGNLRKVVYIITAITVLPALAITVYLLGGIIRILNWVFVLIEDSRK